MAVAERVKGINWKTLAIIIGSGFILWQVAGKFLKFPTPLDIAKESMELITDVADIPKGFGATVWDWTHPDYVEKKSWELLGPKSKDFLAAAPWREDPKGLTQDAIAFLEKQRVDQVKIGNLPGEAAVLPTPPELRPTLSTSEAKEVWEKLGPVTKEALRTASWRDKELPQHMVDYMEQQRVNMINAGLISGLEYE